MSIVIESPSEVLNESEAILAKSRENARQVGLRYAGDVSPSDAWLLFEHGVAKLVDVRTIEERQTVGYVSESIHAAWLVGNPLVSNPRFMRELESKTDKLDVILFLCRSGKRSVSSAETVSRLGFQNVFNISEGFEGDSNLKNGWVNRNLPWTKD
jgi:rhodanese-related sulfurtransferase